MTMFLVALAGALACCGSTGPDQSPRTYKIELTLPNGVKDGKLDVVPGAKFDVAVRVTDLNKASRPDVTFARFLRGKAMAGEFIARPREVRDNEVEYTTTVVAPKQPGRYKLVVAPSRFSETLPGAPPKDQYPELEVRVTK